MKFSLLKSFSIRMFCTACVAASSINLSYASPAAAFSLESPTVNTKALTEHTLEEQKRILIAWLNGEFSNLKHIFEHGPVGGYPPILMRQSTVTLSDEKALWVQQSSLVNPTDTYREHLYRFRINERNNTIVQDIYLLPKGFAGEWVFDELSIAEELELLDGCSISWRADAHSMLGSRDGNFCAFKDELDRVISISSHLTLRPQQLEVVDTAVADDGEPLLGDVDGNALVLNRIRFFHTQLAFLPAGADASSDAEWVAAIPQRPMHDHDQRVALLNAGDGLFLGHDIQVIGDSSNLDELVLRIYRQTEDEPIFSATMEFVEAGRWRATTERLRVELTLAESIIDVLPH